MSTATTSATTVVRLDPCIATSDGASYLRDDRRPSEPMAAGRMRSAGASHPARPEQDRRRSGRVVVAPGRRPRPPAERPDDRGRALLERRRPAFLDTDPWRALRILSEFVEGFDALAALGPAVTVFGSARTLAGTPVYELAREVGRLLAEAGYAVITGGGPGVMEAANRGCQEGGGLSVGCNIELPHEQDAQPVRRPRRRVPLLLRPQDDVREVRRRVRHPARRLRDAGRAVRGARPSSRPARSGTSR